MPSLAEPARARTPAEEPPDPREPARCLERIVPGDGGVGSLNRGTPPVNSVISIDADGERRGGRPPGAGCAVRWPWPAEPSPPRQPTKHARAKHARAKQAEAQEGDDRGSDERPEREYGHEAHAAARGDLHEPARATDVSHPDNSEEDPRKTARYSYHCPEPARFARTQAAAEAWLLSAATGAIRVAARAGHGRPYGDGQPGPGRDRDRGRRHCQRPRRGPGEQPLQDPGQPDPARHAGRRRRQAHHGGLGQQTTEHLDDGWLPRTAAAPSRETAAQSGCRTCCTPRCTRPPERSSRR